MGNAFKCDKCGKLFSGQSTTDFTFELSLRAVETTGLFSENFARKLFRGNTLSVGLRVNYMGEDQLRRRGADKPSFCTSCLGALLDHLYPEATQEKKNEDLWAKSNRDIDPLADILWGE